MICYLSLGSNLGDRAAYLRQAVEALGAHPHIKLLQISAVYETKAVAQEPQPDYLNLAVAIETELTPQELLAVTQQIEICLGRLRPYPQAPRTIDIDLLLCGDISINTKDLTLPHPRMLLRQFVIQPLAELNPELQIGDSPALRQLVKPNDPDVKRIGRLEDCGTLKS